MTETITIPASCAHGVHDLDKSALDNGHHMCVRCPMWLERPVDPHFESVQREIYNQKKTAI